MIDEKENQNEDLHSAALRIKFPWPF